MHSAVTFLASALQITLLDIVLSGDNVGVIALAVRKLEPKDARWASIVGVSGAVALRILFASVVTRLMLVPWLPLRLIGGLLLLKVTWDLIKDESASEPSGLKAHAGFWRAVTSIIIADASMSLDNVLAIGSMASGNIGLIAFGIALNIPILFFGSQFVASLMQKHRIVIYIGGAFLAHTALLMLMEDSLITHYFSHLLVVALPWVLAVTTLGYGFYKTRDTVPRRQISD